MKKAILLTLILALTGGFITAQVINPVSWELSSRNIDRENVQLILKATIASPWHMYGLNIPEGGPIPATINFNESEGFEVIGESGQSPEPEIVDDQIFNMQLELHSKEVTYTQLIRKVVSDSIIITGTVEYMTCSDMQCVLGDYDFTFRLNGLENQVVSLQVPVEMEVTNMDTGHASDSAKIDPNTSTVAPADATATTSSSPDSMLGILLLAMLAGLGGLLTPCVYPMIPMTVSYFLQGTKTRSKAITQALVFGLSIVFIYTMIGVLVAIFKNPNAVNNFTTHWLVNLIFFLIFILLSASFFGMFEIILPSGLANKVDRQADKGGYAGAFFMALAMVILSFSCTGPIIASLLIKAAGGDVLEPVLGMAGFSVVFATPFTLFAIFPSWLKNLPKSGGWLNAVKVCFAFIMLAFSFYFLSKIDQTYHLELLSRELFISIWVVIFGLLGMYLLGKIRFAHDSELPHIGVPRFLFSILSFVFALYLLTGLLGNELRGLSTILPPSGKSSTDAGLITSSSTLSGTEASDLCFIPEYADFLSLPHGLSGYFEYSEALACAGEQNKPVLVDFVGHTCSNCKKMYAEVWSDPRVLKILNEEFIVVALYTDDKTRLPENEWVTSTVDGKVKNTIGKINQDIQISRFNSNALPLYTIVDADGNDLTESYYSYDTDVEAFIKWLEEGLQSPMTL